MVTATSNGHPRHPSRSRTCGRFAAVAAGCLLAAVWSGPKNADAPRARYSADRALNDTARITTAMGRLDPAMAKLKLVCEADPRGTPSEGDRYAWHVYCYEEGGREAQMFLWDMATGKLLLTRRNGRTEDLVDEGKPIRVSPTGAVVAAKTWCRLLYGFTDADNWQAVGAPRRQHLVEYVAWRTRSEKGVVGINRSTGSLAWAALGADKMNVEMPEAVPQSRIPMMKPV